MSMVPGAQHGTTTYGSYILLNEAKEYLQYPLDDTSHDFAFQRIIDAACTSIQTFTDRPIARTLYQPPYGRFNGGSGNTSAYVCLPKFPVLEVVSVIEWQGSTPVTLSEIEPASGGDGFTVDYSTGVIERVMGGVWQRPFIPGERSVWVTWWAGMNPVPADLWHVTMELIRLWFRNAEQQGATKGGGPLNGSQGGGTWSTMPPGIKAELQQWVIPSIA